MSLVIHKMIFFPNHGQPYRKFCVLGTSKGIFDFFFLPFYSAQILLVCGQHFYIKLAIFDFH